MRPEILSDFTADRSKTHEALARLQIPAFSESNLYDAVTDTATRMQDIEGRKSIVLIASGIDTFSKLTFDKTRKILQTASVPIYAIGLMQTLRELYDARGGMGASRGWTSCRPTTRCAPSPRRLAARPIFPRFYGEFPAIFNSISQSLRNQYSLAYNPTNQTRDGKFRKIKVELVNPQGEPLKITDQKGKPIKYTLVATKQGYNAPREVE